MVKPLRLEPLWDRINKVLASIAARSQALLDKHKSKGKNQSVRHCR